MPHELGDFLRARRADAGLEPQAGDARRRRVTGLRREEVAAASGVSVDYYTRLEQGRETNPSDAVLEAIARVLQLTPDATDHLFRLRGLGASMPRERRDVDPQFGERMSAIVAAVRPNPAYILDRLGNMVAANPEGLALYDGFAELPSDQRNTCRYLLLDPRAPQTFADWEQLARGAVAHLRAANADRLDDPELRELVAELSERSPQFRQWWTEHVVARRRAAVTRIRTADGAVHERRHEVLYLPEDGLRMTLWVSPEQE